jgi:adenylate kinase
LLAGIPGAGQEIQAAELAGRGGALRISAGDIFRVNVRDDTELGRVAEPLHGRR